MTHIYTHNHHNEFKLTNYRNALSESGMLKLI